MTRFPARAALFLNRLAGLRVGVVVLANLAELDFGENLQAIVPDGVAQRVEAVHADAVGIPANDEPDAIGLFAVAGAVVEQHADDFIAPVQVDMGDFALRAAHGAGVDLIALAQQFGDFLSECAVDIVLVHDSTSFSFGSCGSRDPLRGFRLLPESHRQAGQRYWSRLSTIRGSFRHHSATAFSSHFSKAAWESNSSAQKAVRSPPSM